MQIKKKKTCHICISLFWLNLQVSIIYLHFYIIELHNNHPHNNIIITRTLFQNFGTEIYFVDQYGYIYELNPVAEPFFFSSGIRRSGSKQMPHEPSMKYLHKI